MGDTLQLHRAVAGEAHRGVGGGMSPRTALSVGLKVDADADSVGGKRRRGRCRAPREEGMVMVSVSDRCRPIRARDDLASEPLTKVQYRAGVPSPRVVLGTTLVTSAPVIAIVDDDPSVRRALDRLVRAAGYGVQTFASAHEFLDAWRERRVACLVLDIHLNGISGFDLQERLVADGAALPIIFISAHDDASTRKRIERSGAAGHLWKPVDERELLGAIRQVIELDEGQET
jgi:CheY-like chemotaxis protein